jgi:hypothetical protein
MTEVQGSHPSWQHHLVRLKYAVQALALPAHLQQTLLPDFVHKADELALDFDHWYDVVSRNNTGQLTDRQRHTLAALAQQLNALHNNEHPQNWSDESLFADTGWEEIRATAHMVLAAFQWPFAVPPSYAHEYVRGQQESEP